MGRLIDQAHGLESCQEREQKAEGTYIRVTAASTCQTTPAIRESVGINVEIKVQTANLGKRMLQ